jgi:surface antigen
MRNPTGKRTLKVVLVVAIATLAVPVASASAATYTVKGTVVCPSGQAVTGIWVRSSAGGADFATNWKDTVYPGRPHVARYSRTLSTNLPSKIGLNVGCGGSTTTWKYKPKTPDKTVSSGSVLYLNTTCTTSACSFYPNRTSTPTYSFFDSSYKDPRGDGKGWCTYRAAAFWKEMTGQNPNWRGDAGDWDDYAEAKKWAIGTVPRPDSIVVWQPGTASTWGHVAYVADVRKYNGALQMKVYDRNWDGKGGDRNGTWVTARSDNRFILAPPRASSTIR